RHGFGVSDEAYRSEVSRVLQELSRRPLDLGLQAPADTGNEVQVLSCRVSTFKHRPADLGPHSRGVIRGNCWRPLAENQEVQGDVEVPRDSNERFEAGVGPPPLVVRDSRCVHAEILSKFFPAPSLPWGRQQADQGCFKLNSSLFHRHLPTCRAHSGRRAWSDYYSY